MVRRGSSRVPPSYKFQRQNAYEEWDAKGGRVVARDPSEIPDDAVSAVSVVADFISCLKNCAFVIRR